MHCVDLLWDVTVIFGLTSQEGWQLGTTQDVLAAMSDGGMAAGPSGQGRDMFFPSERKKSCGAI